MCADVVSRPWDPQGALSLLSFYSGENEAHLCLYGDLCITSVSLDDPSEAERISIPHCTHEETEAWIFYVLPNFSQAHS